MKGLLKTVVIINFVSKIFPHICVSLSPFLVSVKCFMNGFGECKFVTDCSGLFNFETYSVSSSFKVKMHDDIIMTGNLVTLPGLLKIERLHI